MALTSFETIGMLHKNEKLENPVKMGKTHFILFAGFSLAYVFLAPNIFQQDWDSLMYAYWSELRGIGSIWGNHPLGHVIHNSIYIILSNLGFQWRALPVFITCNSVIGGYAVASFFSLMKVLRIGYWFSLAYAIVFGASYGMWHYSGSADIYSLSVLLLILAWMFLLYEVQIRNVRHLYISGALAGLSILSHQLNAVIFLAAIIIILFRKSSRWPGIVTFYSTAIVLIVLGSLLFGYIATSSFSIQGIYDWFRGYLGDAIYGTPLSLESIKVSFRVALETVLVPTWGRARFIRIAIYYVLFALMVLGVSQVKHLDRDRKVVLLSAFLQTLVSGLLIVWFEPWYPKFWLLVLVPGMITLVLCVDALENRFIAGFKHLHGYKKYYSPFLLLAGIMVLAFNMRYAILNEHYPDEASQKSMDVWLKHSDRDDMLITAGDLIPQLWFWSNRPHTIHLYHYLVISKDSVDRFEYLRDQIDQFLCAGNTVIYTPAVVDNFGDSFLIWLDLSRGDLRNFFDEYEKEKYFTYINLIDGQETQVYDLVGPNECRK